MHPEIATLVNEWPADELKRTRRKKIARFNVFDVNDVLLRVDLFYSPCSAEHRANISGASQHVLQRHHCLFRKRFRRMMGAEHLARSGAEQRENICGKPSLIVAGGVFFAVRKSDCSI